MNFYFSIEIVGIVQTSCGIRNIFQSLSSLDLKCFGFLFSHCLFSNFRYIVGVSSQSQKIDTTHRSIKNGKKSFHRLLLSAFHPILMLNLFDLSPFKFHNSHSVILKDSSHLLCCVSSLQLFFFPFGVPSLCGQNTTTLEVLFSLFFDFLLVTKLCGDHVVIHCPRQSNDCMLMLFSMKNMSAALLDKCDKIYDS